VPSGFGVGPADPSESVRLPEIDSLRIVTCTPDAQGRNLGRFPDALLNPLQHGRAQAAPTAAAGRIISSSMKRSAPMALKSGGM